MSVSAQKKLGSTNERIGKPSYQLDEFGLAAGAGLGEYSEQMRLDSARADAQCVRRLRNVVAMASGGDGISSVALCTNRAAAAA
jgi:hypothetical protein